MDLYFYVMLSVAKKILFFFLFLVDKIGKILSRSFEMNYKNMKI